MAWRAVPPTGTMAKAKTRKAVDRLPLTPALHRRWLPRARGAARVHPHRGGAAYTLTAAEPRSPSPFALRA
jgi:hypothetical protein